MSNVDTHRAAHEAFNRRDWAEAVKDFAPDTVYTDLTLKDPEEFTGWMQGWVAAFSDARVSDARYLDAGDHSVSVFTGRGTNDGPFGPFPATGKQAAVPFCEIFRYDDHGRIVAGEMFYDQMTMLVQLGHMEPPPAG